MTRKGLIAAGRVDAGLGYGLMPFVVGVYEMQAGRIDKKLALLFEDYYQEAFGKALKISPSFHRVIPIGESVQMGMEIKPFESASQIVDTANAWGVVDCICRTQKALIGDPCDHPVDVCMILSQKPDAFDHSTEIRALTHDQAIDTLRRSAKAGLVHSVTNSEYGIDYICNCCTCSCGILRGIAEFGIANVVARSAFVNQVDKDLCLGCESCLDYCQFNALYFDDLAVSVDSNRCTGCGVCVPSCPEGALLLVRRPESEILPVPKDHDEWEVQRIKSRKVLAE
jgi:Pyruvate/2-oxoacid:ferredoxin oxidoreductase delta subunit